VHMYPAAASDPGPTGSGLRKKYFYGVQSRGVAQILCIQADSRSWIRHKSLFELRMLEWPSEKLPGRQAIP